MESVFKRRWLVVSMVAFLILSCGPTTKQVETPDFDDELETEVAKQPVLKEAGLNLERYFSDPIFAEALKALDENRVKEALDAFDSVNPASLDANLEPRLRFLIAYLAGLTGDNRRALNELPGLAHQLPLISDTIYECAARSALRLGDAGTALELAFQVNETSTGALEAFMIIADSLYKLGRYEEALSAFSHYLDKGQGSGRGLEVRAKMVRTQVRLIEMRNGDEDSTKELAREALDIIDQLRAQEPTNRWVESLEKSEVILQDLLGLKKSRTPRESKAALVNYEKAQKFMRKRSHNKAENTLARVLRLARKKGTLACRAKYDLALTVSRKRDHNRAAMLFSKTASQCSASDIRIRALYKAAKSFQSVGRWDDAIEHYTKVENDYPAHSYADDARLHAARCQLGKGDRERFVEMLESLPSIYKTGDMRSEALWALAHDALLAEDFSRAKEVLKRYYSLFPRESGWYTAGRSGYWLARTEEILGERDLAAVHYEQVVSSAPLSFYMVLAYNRLAAIDVDHARQLILDLAPVEKKTTFQFPPDMLNTYPKLETGLELYKLGLTTRAKRQLDALLEEPNLPPEVYWLSSTLLRSAGRYSEATRATLAAGDDWKQRYPVGDDYTQWTMAYPTAYEEEVREAASTNDITPSMIWAVMREESGFNPRVESWANAIGLMQLILPTAQRVGRRLGIRATRGTLRDPQVNITLGTAYLAHLKKLFEGHPVFMIAGYNAGEGAVARWLRERNTDDLDIFIEEIPYDQTRGYTKRVIASLAAYELLYGEEHGVLKLDLSVKSVD